MECEICGKTHGKSGKPFTLESLKQHMKNAHGHELGDPNFERTDMIADDDMPDGAYFAIASELGDL